MFGREREMGSGFLEVELIDAKHIKKTNFISRMNPYVLIQYGDQEFRSSVAKGQGRNPVWNEKFKFNAKYPEDHKYKLTFQIMDENKLSADEFVGESTIYVKDVISMGLDVGKAEISHRKYRVVLPDKTYAGEISIALNFYKYFTNE